jgi:hypothetical protein
MTASRKSLRSPTGALLLLVASMCMSCGVICPTTVHRYVLDPVANAPASSALVGGVFLEPLETADEFSSEYMVFVTDDTRIIENAEDKAWPAAAPLVVHDALTRLLDARYPGAIRAALFPPPEWIVRGRIERMAFMGMKSRGGDTAALEIRFEIRRREDPSYRVLVSRLYSARVPVDEATERKDGSAYAAAMSRALGQVAAAFCRDLDGMVEEMNR